MKNLISIIEKLKISSNTKVYSKNDWSINKAEDGDFVCCLNDVFFIYKGLNKDVLKLHNIDDNAIIYHASLYDNNVDIGPCSGVGTIDNNYEFRLMTDKEHQNFIEALNKKGYKWDEVNLKVIKK